MPVSSGRWLSNSVNASSPPAEGPTPTIRGPPPSACSSAASRAIAAPEAGVTAAVEVFPGERVRRFGRGESGARGERATPPGRPLPVFFATGYHYLSRRDERASSLETEVRRTEHVECHCCTRICAGFWSLRLAASQLTEL